MGREPEIWANWSLEVCVLFAGRRRNLPNAGTSFSNPWAVGRNLRPSSGRVGGGPSRPTSAFRLDGLETSRSHPPSLFVDGVAGVIGDNGATEPREAFHVLVEGLQPENLTAILALEASAFSEDRPTALPEDAKRKGNALGCSISGRMPCAF